MGAALNGDYLAVQVNGMLAQLKYKPVKDDSPWIDLNLSGDTNAKAAAEILDWIYRPYFMTAEPWNPFIKRWGILRPSSI